MHVSGVRRDIFFQGYKIGGGAIVTVAENKVFCPDENRVYHEFMISGTTFFPDQELEDIPSFSM